MARPSESPPSPATPGLLRSINDRVVLELLITHPTLSRGDVRRLTGVSKPTASQLLSRLEESGHVVQNGVEEHNRGGRASAIYELNPRAGFAAAINVTATGTHARVADLRGTVIGEHRDPGESGPETAITSLRYALSTAELEMTDLTSIVVSLPGSYDPDADTLRFAGHLPRWQQPGLVEGLEAITGVETHIENDVNVVAMAEQQSGAVRGESDFFLLWSDEGIGGALMLGGRIHRGSTGGASEVAFLPVPGVPIVRNPARENHGGFDDLAGVAQVVELGARHGIHADSAAEIVASAVASDAHGFLDELAGRYAPALATIIALIDPPVIVLAGAVLNAGGPGLLDLIRDHVDEVAIRTPRFAAREVIDDPVAAGALLVSLNHTRNAVFST
ncbi:ROK family transcriptional regulator [Salinibacterium sp. G-O1]|uniref:ROK family transcriptional regulator n=1 Tax=Salinibacterium sp. G-O1 TaxID=3046208 RepID=UPI0024B97491|nr:ROK family transcriptional regulator [Salinibacterium sp. G-O1]MDJ0335249.1 ROK family transcriptional regulator [Salinibacterium sp. G-O1]